MGAGSLRSYVPRPLSRFMLCTGATGEFMVLPRCGHVFHGRWPSHAYFIECGTRLLYSQIVFFPDCGADSQDASHAPAPRVPRSLPRRSTARSERVFRLYLFPGPLVALHRPTNLPPSAQINSPRTNRDRKKWGRWRLLRSAPTTPQQPPSPPPLPITISAPSPTTATKTAAVRAHANHQLSSCPPPLLVGSSIRFSPPSECTICLSSFTGNGVTYAVRTVHSYTLH